jgi:hypothetical protein
MTSGPITNLVRMQDTDGCFPSEVVGPDWTYTDRNGFTTAMVLRALRDLSNESAIERVRSTALDFVERCRSTQTPCAFGFWPEDMRPVWSPRLPADIDDTAIITIELLRHGRLSRREGLRTVCSVFVHNRIIIRDGQSNPPWVMSGAFPTWIGQKDKPNIVDCCVNANATALMALVGGTHLPGYQEAVSTILNGIAWAGHDPIRHRTLTPFYPSIHELQDAVENAVECGVKPLSSALNQLRKVIGDRDSDVPPGCCSSAYGATVWRCRGLEEARLLRAQQMLAQIAS